MLVYYPVQLSEGGPFVITADSVPDLDDWGSDDWWSCHDWIVWHDEMKKAYGLDYANRTLIDWWDKQTFGAGPLDCRSFNTEFIEYAKANGFHDALYGGPLAIIKPFSAVTQVVSGASDVVGGVGSNLKWIVPVAVIGGLGIIGLILAKRYG